MPELRYNGQSLLWIENGRTKHRYEATSGMAAFEGVRSYQRPADQCVKDAGPIPEGTYVLQLEYNKNLVAIVSSAATCEIKSVSSGIQQIPTASKKNSTAHCAPYWNNWGSNRVRINAYDTKARTACGGNRDGFYIHDSAKGYTHGCIEVQHAFFKDLYDYVNTNPKFKQMFVQVNYSGVKSTLGKTAGP